MRITNHQREMIERTISKQDSDAEIYLFGSRVDDGANGGDIDLLVVSQKLSLMDKLDILGELHRALGDRRIDLLITDDLSQPVVANAMEQGVRL